MKIIIRAVIALILSIWISNPPQASAWTTLAYSMPDGASRGLSAGIGDIDSDGQPEILLGSRGGRNALDVYKIAPGAAPRFVLQKQLFTEPIPDDLEVADFNADGRLDILTAQFKGARLQVFYGDGRGQFQRSEVLTFEGNITSLSTGEINRADGIPDMVLAISSHGKHRLLIFESPHGTFQGAPEEVPVDGPAASVVLGRLNADPWIDAAWISNGSVWMLAGRDRRLSLNREKQASAGQPRVAPIIADFEAVEATAGDFVADPDHRSDLAVLDSNGRIHLLQHSPIEGWRIASSFPAGSNDVTIANRLLSHGNEIIAWNSKNARANGAFDSNKASMTTGLPEGLFQKASRILAGRINQDAIPDFVIIRPDGWAAALSTPANSYIVNSTADTTDGTCDASNCTLREAIENANASAGLDSIDFSGLSTGQHTINILSALPTITEPIILDGSTHPDGLIEMVGPTNVVVDGLNISGGGSSVTGFTIYGFRGDGINLNGSGGNLIYGNFIGRVSSVSNVGSGIHIAGSPNNVVGGTVTGQRNVLSGNGTDGIRIDSGATGNQVIGNYLGLAADSTPLGNSFDGITILSSDNNVVGGTLGGTANVISGNLGGGITITGNANLVQGNLIGTDPSGTSLATGQPDGLSITAGTSNTIGGTTPAAKNLISGAAYPVVLRLGAAENLIQGNFVGTNLAGTQALANSFFGVECFDTTSSNVIGGAVAGAGNLISGNGGAGVEIARSGAVGNIVQGNLIGTDISGQTAIPNASGISVTFGASNTVIGGSTPGERNIVSGNNGVGIVNDNAQNTLIQGNFVGTDISGTQPLGNLLRGIAVGNSTGVFIGGASPGDGNLVSANKSDGISVLGNTTVLGNLVGTDITGTQPLGNLLNGIAVFQSNNTLGLFVMGPGNIVAYNGMAGIAVGFGVGNSIAQSSIFSNGGLGIDLNSDGVTPNDLGDGDIGPNNFQNYPNLTSATTNFRNVRLRGTFNSKPFAEYYIEIFQNDTCDPSGHGEGATFIDTRFLDLDASGNATIDYTLLVVVPPGKYLTATATDPYGNTSEFSECVPVIASCTLYLLPSSLPGGQIGTPYNQAVAGGGGVAPYSYAVTAGALPDGLSLNSITGTISGTPLVSGDYNFTVTVTDAFTCTGSRDYSIAICSFCDDFEDGLINPGWFYMKPAWSEDGHNLVGVPQSRMAIASANPIFPGCSRCSFEATLSTPGGQGSKAWLLAWNADKRNRVELIMIPERGVWILKERVNGNVIAKAKASATIDPNTFYRARISFDGTTFTVTINGNTLLSLNASAPHNGSVGFQTKSAPLFVGEVIVN